jgi:lysophospholipase L1-like esterase
MSARRSLMLAATYALPVLVLWGATAVLSRRTDLWSILATRTLFDWAVPATLVAAGGIVVTLARKPRTAALACIMVALTLAAIVGLAEAMTALRLAHWGLIAEKIAGEDRIFSWAFTPDAELGWRRRPNDRFADPALSDIESGWAIPASRNETLTYQYDKWGYHNPESRDRADVVLIGDSYVEGAYNHGNENVARRLEARLGRPVMNMGVAGYGTKQQYAVLEKDAVRFAPRVVLFFFFEGNDLYDDATIESMQGAAPDEGANPRQGLAHTHEWDRRAFVPNLLRLLRRWSDPVLPNHAPYFGIARTPPHAGETVLFADYAAVTWTSFEERRWAIAAETMAKAADFARERGAEIAFLFIPIKFRVYRDHVDIPADSPMRSWGVWPTRERFAAFCAAHAVPCIDLTGEFEAAVAAGGMPYARADTHWSAEGHDLVAKRIAAEIESRGWMR